VDRPDQTRRRRRPGRPLDVRGHVRFAETLQRDLAHVRLAGQLPERRGERLARRRVDIAVGARDQQPRGGALAGDEPQHEKRRLVRGMQVVEYEHERSFARGAAQERGGGVEQAEARALGVGAGRRPDVGVELTQLGQQLSQVGGARSELLTQRLRVRLLHVAAQGLNPGPVGGRAAGLPAAPDEHGRAPLPRAAGELLGEAALADPGLAAHEHDTPARRECVLERLTERGDLALASHEDAAGAARPATVLSREVERRVLREDRLVQIAKRPAGLDAQLVDERAAGRLVGLERLGLATAAV
jgi:hypothetical protein